MLPSRQDRVRFRVDSLTRYPMLATATFSLKQWEETAYDEIDGGPKLTRANVLYGFDGELSGEGRLQYLMSYLPDGSAIFSGFQRFVGRVGSHEGSFIFRHGGRFADGIATDTWTVVDGSGTSGLRGITGQIEFSAGHQETYEIIFDYSLPDSD